MWEIPNVLIQQSNQLYDPGCFVLLIFLDIPGNPIRFANTNEDIVWNGYTWHKSFFKFDDMSESDKPEVPSLGVSLPNINSTITAAVESINGGVGENCTLYLVHTEHLSETQVPTYKFKITGASTDKEWAYFELGGKKPFDKRVPQRRLIKNYCPFRFKDTEENLCQYDGTDSTCNKTLADCRNKSNSKRFGGFPGVGTGKGFYA